MSIEKLIKKAIHLKECIENDENELKKVKIEIQKQLEAKGVKKYIIDIDDQSTANKEPKVAIVQKVERINVNYNVDMLEEKIDKEVCYLIIDKNYIIEDYAGLIKLLKKYGVNPKEFKRFIRSNKSVNKDKIKQLFDIGEITIEELKGCYTAKLNKSIQITTKVKE